MVPVEPSAEPASLSAETIFLRWFWPLYGASRSASPGTSTAPLGASSSASLREDARAELARLRATDANPANNPSILRHLEEAAEVFVAMAPAVLGATDLRLDFSDASVHRLSAALTHEVRDRLAAEGVPGSPESALFNVIVHGAAYVGECARRGRDAKWGVRSPLWESVITLRSAAGEGDLAIFSWWLKSLADEAFAEGGARLADRYRMHVEVPTARWEELPVIAPPDRRLPRIAKRPRYDVLYKHLKAHLPELRDLGADFPSSERFAELELKWLDFLLVGQGRMLVMFGLGEGGLHLFWLDRSGFQKALFVPCDAFPDPVVKLDGDRLRVHCSTLGKAVTHELLWWGA